MRSWRCFEFEAERDKFYWDRIDRAYYGVTVLVGHYLFLFARGYHSGIWTIDLRDNSIRKRQFTELCDDENHSLNNYGENQLIKFGSELFLITIDSFDGKTP